MHGIRNRLAALLQLVNTLLLIASLAVMSGCAQYPMGLNQDQWQSLSPEQQADYTARQQAIDAERAKQAAIRREEQARLAAERERAEQERLEAAYRHARYGDIIVVTVEGGEIAFGGKRHPYEPIAFELVRGERKEVRFSRLGRHHQTTGIVMRLSEDGNTFYFDEPARKRIVITNNGWDRGRTYGDFPVIENRDGRSEAMGISIRIAYKPVGPRHHH